MRANALLLAMFGCTLGQVSTTLGVVGAFSGPLSADFPLGAGVGLVFCAAGSLIGAISLPWLRARMAVQSMGWFAVLTVFLSAALLYALVASIPRWTAVAGAAMVSSAAYVILNYGLSMSVFSLEPNVRANAVVRRISLPFLVAQAVGPLVTGWLLEALGWPALVGLIATSYLIAAASVLHRVGSASCTDDARAGDSSSAGPATLALAIVVISAFAVNWYFATTLSHFSGENLPPTLLGAVMSAIQVAAFLGAAMVSRKSTPAGQVRQLFLSAIILFPGLVALQGLSAPASPGITLTFLLIVGALTGVVMALAAAIKFGSVSEGQFTEYQRRLSVLTLLATLGGALVGSSALLAQDWHASIIACAAVCLLLGMRYAPQIQRLVRTGTVTHGPAQ